MSAVMEVDGVTVRIARKPIVERVSLSVSRGEAVALVGPNGAGKSTLMRVMSGEMVPHSGAAKLKGRAIASYAPRTLALHRAVLSQSVSVAFPFTVGEVVRMGAGDRRAGVDDMVEDALAEVDLEDFHDRVITTLSGGEQQRAHLARVLVQLCCCEAAHGPGLLLLDEPTASLDLRHQIEIGGTLRRLRARGVAVVAVLHDLNLATLLADRVMVLDRGSVACEGPPSAAITDDMLARVFGICGAVGHAPGVGVPFVLPQQARPAPRQVQL